MGYLLTIGFGLLIGLVWGKAIGRKKARQERVIMAEEEVIELKMENTDLREKLAGSGGKR